MRLYEAMLILSPELEENEVRKETDRFGAIITEGGGTVGKIDHWGKRRFAYEMKQQVEGYYVVMEIMAETPALDEFARVASLSDSVLRHKVVRLPEPAQKAG